jgi:predicted GNAT family acetyltransferase
VASAGFWPGGGGIDYPAFYAYAYPSPQGFKAAPVQPDGAFWHETLGEFVLPYAAVQSAADPEAALTAFLQSTYEAAADLGQWDRDLLECGPGHPRQVRAHDAGLNAPAAAAIAGVVEREDGPTRGRYRIVIDGVEAEMTYSRVSPELIIIDHTGVPDAMRGRKVGESLVRQAVEDARRDGVFILPLCPFAKAQINRHPEWQDVLQRSGV